MFFQLDTYDPKSLNHLGAAFSFFAANPPFLDIQGNHSGGFAPEGALGFLKKVCLVNPPRVFCFFFPIFFFSRCGSGFLAFPGARRQAMADPEVVKAKAEDAIKAPLRTQNGNSEEKRSAVASLYFCCFFCLESPSDPLKKWVHHPMILDIDSDNDPIFGRGEKKGRSVPP